MSEPVTQSESERERDGAEAHAAPEREVSYGDSVPGTVVLLAANLLLRFLGEHAWAYWIAAVIGVLGVAVAAFGIASAVRSLRRGRRVLLALAVIALLLGACVVLVARLVEHF
ncbi:hypothetical protein AB0D46_09450 [Streptomyces sp. NPDC048383]|uniref:hypothetical protein n=1 Tax=Streptomyces sp. NPDC048383 TaxID=3155386 RepID=UPI00344968FE